jgi:hypothetical protein
LAKLKRGQSICRHRFSQYSLGFCFIELLVEFIRVEHFHHDRLFRFGKMDDEIAENPRVRDDAAGQFDGYDISFRIVEHGKLKLLYRIKRHHFDSAALFPINRFCVIFSGKKILALFSDNVRQFNYILNLLFRKIDFMPVQQIEFLFGVFGEVEHVFMIRGIRAR